MLIGLAILPDNLGSQYCCLRPRSLLHEFVHQACNVKCWNGVGEV